MDKCVLVTGSAKRIGAAIVRELHTAGYRVIIHCRGSLPAANSLKDELNRLRPESAEVLTADLLQMPQLASLAEQAISTFGRIDGLINNASAFYPTPLYSVTEAQWDELIDCNLKAPFFLTLALRHELERRNGAVVNVTDIHALRPLQNFPVYSISKTGMNAMTLALAREFAPSVRVNGVAPGAILWPESSMAETDKQRILARIPLKRMGKSQDIAEAVSFLLRSEFISGQILAIDGGRSICP